MEEEVSLYDGKSIISITDKEGLANNIVVSMLQDKAGNLWLGSTYGLNEINTLKLEEMLDKIKSGGLPENTVFFKNYGIEDGFLGIG